MCVWRSEILLDGYMVMIMVTMISYFGDDDDDDE